MVIVFPTDTSSVITAIRNVIGRPVLFNYVAGHTNCTVCTLDPATDTSSNAFCPVCSGTYYIPVMSGYTTEAFISWAPAEIMNWNVGGQLLGGDCTIQVSYSGIISYLDKVTTVEVDGKIMEIKKKVYRGVPSINRVLLSLMEIGEE